MTFYLVNSHAYNYAYILALDYLKQLAPLNRSRAGVALHFSPREQLRLAFPRYTRLLLEVQLTK